MSASIPEAGFLRLHQIIGNPKAEPPIAAIVPVCKTSWYAGIKAGIYPKSVKISSRAVAWKASDIRALIKSIGAEG